MFSLKNYQLPTWRCLKNYLEGGASTVVQNGVYDEIDQENRSEGSPKSTARSKVWRPVPYVLLRLPTWGAVYLRSGCQRYRQDRAESYWKPRMSDSCCGWCREYTNIRATEDAAGETLKKTGNLQYEARTTRGGSFEGKGNGCLTSADLFSQRYAPTLTMTHATASVHVWHADAPRHTPTTDGRRVLCPQ